MSDGRTEVNIGGNDVDRIGGDAEKNGGNHAERAKENGSDAKDERAYVLTIYNQDIFKEVSVSEDFEPVRIGNLQDCDVRLKRELFDIPVQVTLQKRGRDFVLSCQQGTVISSKSAKACGEISVRHGDIVEVHDSVSGDGLFSVSFSYDFSFAAHRFDTIVDIRNQRQLYIGNLPQAQIKLVSPYVGKEFLLLSRDAGGALVLDPTHAPSSATHNGVRIFQKIALEEYDFIGIADFSFYYKNQVFYTSHRKDMVISGLSAQPLRDETPAFQYPKLNRSPRMIYAQNNAKLEILNPPKKPEKPKENLVLQFTPVLLMLAVIVLTRSGLIGGMSMGGNMSFLIFSVASMSVGILTSIMSIFYTRKNYRKELAEWTADYTAYIAGKRAEIEGAREAERAALLDVYPGTEELREMVKTFSGRLFERSVGDEDFLYVRAGLGDVLSLRQIEFHQGETIRAENEFATIPEQLQREYAYLHHAPVLLHLKQAGTIGIIGSSVQQYEFFKKILLEVCVQHSNEDVKIIVLIPANGQGQYGWIKWLPHIKDSAGNMRGIVCDDESRDNVFEHLYALMAQREAALREDREFRTIPHYVVFVLEEYGIKTHPLSKYAEDAQRYGVSFVYFKHYKENLPLYCREIVECTSQGGVLRLRNDKEFSGAFSVDPIADESIEFIAERLAPVYCEKIALSSRLTSNITLFELLNIISPEDLNLSERWRMSNVTKSLAAPLGVDAKGEQILLDLHERAHGPHGLVAGTTGSGKSEIMQSYILSIASKYHPYEISFVIIDFKGGGMANQFEDLPHLIGKITDIDSHEIQRSLLSIRAELEKRKRYFAEAKVNHIDQYIEKYRRAEIEQPLPHIILIVDEFAELKAEQPEFMKELISTARVGRSLGIHLILATQKPSGQVNEQIWSNSRFKLCLKVATKQDSNEVLKTPLAAEIKEPGRAYLQVGNNEIFSLFQSAYSGASASSDRNGNMREFSIAQVSFTGKRTPVFEQKIRHAEDGSKMTQLRAMVDYVHDHCKQAGIPRLPSICLPPLASEIDYPSGASGVSPGTARGTVVGRGGTVVPLGVYDDPGSQRQPEVEADLLSANVMIVGSAQTGKTTMLQTMLRGIADRYSPAEVNVYILDFASKVLKIFEDLNHVGGVILDVEDEKIKNFFKMIQSEIRERKDKFAMHGVGSYQAYCESAGKDLPHIILMIDNLAVLKEVYPEHEDTMLNICREGLAVGVTVVATAKQTAGLSYKYMSNFSKRFALNCTESSEYSTILDRCPIRPKNIAGRGLLSVDKVVYEYQNYLPFDGIPEHAEADENAVRSEARRIEQIRAYIREVADRYSGVYARKIPMMPQTLTADYWKGNNLVFPPYVVPVGLTYSTLETVSIDTAAVGSLAIYGREGFGRNNLVRLILNHLQQNVFEYETEVYVIDGYERRLEPYKHYGVVKEYTIDGADFEYVLQRFHDAAEDRTAMLKEGKTLENEPLMLCLVQNPSIYSASNMRREIADLFRQVVNNAKQLKLCFLFSEIENNGDFSPPEIHKAIREFPLLFMLDDLVNIKLFGTNSKISPQVLNANRKNIVLGDGFLYDAKKGVEKVKLAKAGQDLI